MAMYFFGGSKLKGSEVEAPRIIPPNHTPLLLPDLGMVKKTNPYKYGNIIPSPIQFPIRNALYKWFHIFGHVSPIKGWFLVGETNMNGGLQYISIWVMVKELSPNGLFHS